MKEQNLGSAKPEETPDVHTLVTELTEELELFNRDFEQLTRRQKRSIEKVSRQRLAKAIFRLNSLISKVW